MKSARASQISNIGYGVLLALLCLMPFHAFFTTWLGSSFGQRAVWQSWKEVLIILVTVVFAYLLATQPKLRAHIFGWWVNWVIFGYGLLHILLAVLWPAETQALLFGLRTNLAFLVLFVLAQIVGYYKNPTDTSRTITRILVATGTIVGIFGVLQMSVLPEDFLRHFGYGKDTIRPFLTIGEQGGPVRILATLGGPNQLGQFLVLPLAVGVAEFFKKRNFWYLLATLPMLVALYGSYSRSAWVAVLVAVVCIVFINVSKKLRIVLLGTLLGLCVAAGLLIIPLRHTSFVSQVILHAPGAGVESSSDTQRANAINNSLKQIWEQPLGHGPGTAGPAALRSQTAGTLSENYYLQLGIEIGIIGLVAFLAILAGVAVALWLQVATSTLAAALLSSFVGFCFINLVLHGWADSTTALMWWGAAGVIIREK